MAGSVLQLVWLPRPSEEFHTKTRLKYIMLTLKKLADETGMTDTKQQANSVRLKIYNMYTSVRHQIKIGQPRNRLPHQAAVELSCCKSYILIN